MKVLRTIEYEKVPILVLKHWIFYQYVFVMKGQWYMQFTHHFPPLLSILLGGTMGDEEAVANTMVDYAKRSIDKILDPTAEHCEHGVKTKGENFAVCVACAKKDRVFKFEG